MSSSKRLLITGAEGLIGKILVDKLDGYDIIRLDSGKGKSRDWIDVDISNYNDLTAMLKRHLPISAILHLAADSAVDASWESVLSNNIIGTRNVFEFAREHSVGRIVFASSNRVTYLYEADPSFKTIHPQMPVRPGSYYAVSKVFGEALARLFSEEHGISVICLRIGTVLENDDPSGDERSLRTWLSHKDLVGLVTASLRSDVRFGIYYGVSNNLGRFWDISNVSEELQYDPEDDATRRVQGTGHPQL